MRLHAATRAELFTVYGIDVFVFPRGLFGAVPAFSLGRSAWDNWIVADARRQGWPVVDVTAPYTVIHQDHSYSGFASIDEIRRSQQGLRNFWLAGDSHFLLGRVDDATHRLDGGKIVSSGRKLVSVVILSAHNPSQLRLCLRALSHQSYPRSYIEIVLVESLGENSAMAMAEFPYIRLTRETTRGSGAAMNKGAAIANGELLAFLDPDGTPAFDWLEKAVAAAGKAGFASIVSSRIKPQLTDSQSGGVQWYDGINREEQSLTAAALLVPRTVWQEIGPFDEKFREAAGEHGEWFARATARRVPLTYASDAIVNSRLCRTWSELRDKSRLQARHDVRRALRRARYKSVDNWPFFRAYTRQFFSSMRAIFRSAEVPRRMEMSMALAAGWTWFWMLIASRKELRSMQRERLRLRVVRMAKRTRTMHGLLPIVSRPMSRKRR